MKTFKELMLEGKNAKVDFHAHTTNSPNGQTFWNLCDYIDACFENGVEFTAITDYYTGGLKTLWETDILEKHFDAVKRSSDKTCISIHKGNKKLFLFNGIETAVRLDGNIVDVLTYGFSYDKFKQSNFKYYNPHFRDLANVTNTRSRVEKAIRLGLMKSSANYAKYIQLIDGEKIINFWDMTNECKHSFLDYLDKMMSSTNIEPKPFIFGGKSYEIGVNNTAFAEDVAKGISFQKEKNSLSPVVEKYLKEQGLFDNLDSIKNPTNFARLLLNKKDSFLFVENVGIPKIRELVEFAHSIDATTVLAHPFNYLNYTAFAKAANENKCLEYSDDENEKYKKLENVFFLIDNALDEGVDGVEVMHGFNSLYQSLYLINNVILQEKRRGKPLIATMGSDTHRNTTGANYGDHLWLPGQTVGYYSKLDSEVETKLAEGRHLEFNAQTVNEWKSLAENNIEIDNENIIQSLDNSVQKTLTSLQNKLENNLN